MTDFATDALSAWNRIVSKCGLEPKGRDKTFVDQLIHRLSPGEVNLNKVLTNITTDQLLDAIFANFLPFGQMYKEVLNFFFQANARTSKNNIQIMVQKSPVNLKFFEKLIEVPRKSKGVFEAPDVDFEGAWILYRARKHLFLQSEDDRAWSKPFHTGLVGVDNWLEAYSRGVYLPLPVEVAPEQFEGGLRDAALIMKAALNVIMRIRMNREELIHLRHQWRAERGVTPQGDAYHPATIGQNETDFWLRSSVVLLARALFIQKDQVASFEEAQFYFRVDDEGNACAPTV